MPHSDDIPASAADALAGDGPRRPRRVPLDIRVDTPGREGLAGTTPGSIYKPLADREQLTIPPDGQSPADQPQWRKDFPVDWPQDHYVARRDFTKFLVLTSFAFAVGQIWIGVQNFRRRRHGLPPVRRIASLAQMTTGTTLSFNYPGEHDPCVLVRLTTGELVAYSQKCTHLSCAVIPRPESGVIYCPCHEGLFDLKTGNVIAGPAFLPRPLPRVLLEVRGEAVYATGIELRTV